MRKIWLEVNSMPCSINVKNAVFLAVTICIWLAAGAVLWGIAGRWVLPDIVWMFCFAGYAGLFIGMFGGILYLYRHHFS